MKVEVPFLVKTVPLHHLSSAEAMKLLAPYVRTPGGGVFEVSPNIHAVTVRETQTVFNEMMAVLERYDRDPATVVLNFQLIAAENTNTRDPAVASLDTLLRSVLKFSGYRLLTTSVAAATEGQSVSQTLSADGDPLILSVGVSELRTEGSDASVQLYVRLARQAITATPQNNGIGRPRQRTVLDGRARADWPDCRAGNVGGRRRTARDDPHRPPTARQEVGSVHTKRDERVHAARSSRRQVAREKRHAAKHRRHRDERQRVRRRNAEELIAQES